MSDTDKLAAILRMADPSQNSSHQERKVALKKAHDIMDKSGLSYASVGLSSEDAYRIENQFSVATPGSSSQRSEESTRESFSIFRRSTGEVQKIQPREKTSSYQEPKRRRVEQQPQESYVDRCERENRERWDKKYDDWVAWRRQEDAKEAENAKWGFKASIVLVAIMVLCVSFFVLTGFSQ